MPPTRRNTAVALLLAAGLVASCASQPRTQVMPVAESTDCVVLLHGLNRSWRMMRPMAEAMSAMLPDADDGKVSVTATRVDGMDDSLVVDNSHRYIPRSDVVFRNTVSFLRTGRFIDADRSLVTGCTEQAGGNNQSTAACF